MDERPGRHEGFEDGKILSGEEICLSQVDGKTVILLETVHGVPILPVEQMVGLEVYHPCEQVGFVPCWGVPEGDEDVWNDGETTWDHGVLDEVYVREWEDGHTDLCAWFVMESGSRLHYPLSNLWTVATRGGEG
jgi:hypothetical protein